MALSEDCEDCTIYYTLNGSDPRLLVTGKLLPMATAYSQPAVLNTSPVLRLMILQGDLNDPRSWQASSQLYGSPGR